MLIGLAILALMHDNAFHPREVHDLLHDILLPRCGLLRMFVQEQSAASILDLVYFADALEMLDGRFLALLILLWFRTHSFVESLPWREVCTWWTAHDKIRFRVYS